MTITRGRSGFTFIEAALMVGILGLIAAFTTPLYRSYQIRHDLAIAKNQVIQGLERTKLNAQAGKNSSPWSFYVPQGVMFRGTDYAAHDPAFAETYPMPSTINTSGITQVTYDWHGQPNVTGDIVLTAISGEEDRITVSIAVSSQAVNMSSSSSLSPPLPPSLCPVAFTIQSDGSLLLTGDADATFTNMEAKITFGEGGPPIDVRVCYSAEEENEELEFNHLFGGSGDCNGNGIAKGHAVEPNGTDVNDISFVEGKRLVLRVNGRYKQNNWLAFDETFQSDARDGHIVFFANGSQIPDYPAYNGNPSLRSYLQSQGKANGQGIAMLDVCELLMVTELGALGQPSADFQDDVLLMRFE